MMIVNGVWMMMVNDVWMMIVNGVWVMMVSGVWMMIVNGVWMMIVNGVWMMIVSGVWMTMGRDEDETVERNYYTYIAMNQQLQLTCNIISCEAGVRGVLAPNS